MTTRLRLGLVGCGDFGQSLGKYILEVADIVALCDIASNRMEVEWLDRAANHYQQSLQIDPENVTAHYGLTQVFARLDRSTQAEKHRQLHEKYRRDDNAHDLALASARRSDSAANHASEAVVIYELQRRGAYGLPVDR